LITAVLSASAYADTPEIGKVAPNFTVTDIEGKVHNLSDYRGKVVVLEWVNPECPFVRKHYESGNIPQLQKSTITDGAVWLLINSGQPGAQGDYTPTEVKDWQKKTVLNRPRIFVIKMELLGEFMEPKRHRICMSSLKKDY
jgi:glutathione peroxidase-family protein